MYKMRGCDEVLRSPCLTLCV